MNDTVARSFWDREIVEPTHVSWMDDPRVGESIDRLFGDGVPISRGDWFVARTHGRKFERGLSIGCGVGNLEREAIRRDICKRIDAFDGSLQSIRIAQVAATTEGYAERLRYFVANFNEPALPPDTYDIVFFNQSLHHVGNLEALYSAILRAMRPDALLYLDEYIGPSRTDWNDALIAPHRAAYDALPAEARKSDVLPLPIQPDDPSEAIRSSEILEQLRIGFDVETMRDYGGNLLAVLYPQIEWARAPEGTLQRLIEEDRAMAKNGSYYAVVIARPVRGVRRVLALWRWFLESRLKRFMA